MSIISIQKQQHAQHKQQLRTKQIHAEHKHNAKKKDIHKTERNRHIKLQGLNHLLIRLLPKFPNFSNNYNANSPTMVLNHTNHSHANQIRSTVINAIHGVNAVVTAEKNKITGYLENIKINSLRSANDTNAIKTQHRLTEEAMKVQSVVSHKVELNSLEAFYAGLKIYLPIYSYIF